MQYDRLSQQQLHFLFQLQIMTICGFYVTMFLFVIFILWIDVELFLILAFHKWHWHVCELLWGHNISFLLYRYYV